ncbi:hypothetical protein ACTMU2_23575 [Cupriavidus basilensis]
MRQYEGVVKTDQGNVDNARLQLGYTKVVAPVSGRIGLRQVDPGNIVNTSDTNGIALITQIQPIAVLYTIPEDNLPAVLKKLNTGEKMQVQAWDRQMRNQLGDGTLLTTDNQIDYHHRHGQDEGRVPEHRRHAVPEPVRQCAHARRYAEGRHRDSDRGGPARTAGHLRLRGRRQQQGQGGGGHAGTRRRRAHRRAQGPGARPARGGGRRRPAQGRHDRGSRGSRRARGPARAGQPAARSRPAPRRQRLGRCQRRPCRRWRQPAARANTAASAKARAPAAPRPLLRAASSKESA